MARLVAIVLRGGAAYDPTNFSLWEKRGYHITPVHFYQPVPDTRELAQLLYPRISKCPGIDLQSEPQARLLREVFPQYAEEYNNFPAKQSLTDISFYLDNDAFTGIDPHVYHCMVRHFQPRTIIEVGSGYSTLLAAQAIQRNATGRLIAVDPWPRDFIAAGVEKMELVCRKVEELTPEFFLQLQANDILFVDSSHVIRTAGDVGFLLLEVLPTLRPGVFIHFHDIFLPYDYPKEWLLEKHLFWTEQYLLQAYLADNSKVEVVFASNFMAHQHPQALRTVFPKALWWGGGSFWIRKA